MAGDKVRVACVQYGLAAIDSYAEFDARIARFAAIAASYKADFVLFPEMFTLQLLTVAHRGIPAREAVAALDGYTKRIKASFAEIAARHKLHVVGGSHFARDADGTPRNVCYVAMPDGTLVERAKIHATPSEREAWGIVGGSDVAPIATAFGPVAVTICYDCEFPELTRHLTDAGARLFFVPFCTDDRRAYLRVRHCAAARAIENQSYQALAGNVGILPFVENMDVQYAQSCVLTPSDMHFARDGIAVEAAPNVEAVEIVELDFAQIEAGRAGGSVRNLADRRTDLYRVAWRG